MAKDNARLTTNLLIPKPLRSPAHLPKALHFTIIYDNHGYLLLPGHAADYGRVPDLEKVFTRRNEFIHFWLVNCTLTQRELCELTRGMLEGWAQVESLSGRIKKN